MSNAGVRSNRGDKYQTLVALDWALTVLLKPASQWIEVDSVTYLVDDVVIGHTGGSLICCQCKKNQPDFEHWSLADLNEELIKAARLLEMNPAAKVRFYSRSPFGRIQKLSEYSEAQPDEATYRAGLTKEHQKTDSELAAILLANAPTLSSYEFVRRTGFNLSQDFERMQEFLLERLSAMASNPTAAYDALWRQVDQLGARMGGDGSVAISRHRLTKEDLKATLHGAGAMLVPTMEVAEVQASFASISSIGRSWRRDISGRRILSPLIENLLEAIDAGQRSILVTGLPGSGKTCVLLALQDELELRARATPNIVPLFIQSREFADLATARDRAAQGLPDLWVEKAARMADEARVVVVIDSLDVLSIAREHGVLKYFLTQIDRLLQIPKITVVTACRDFDRHYDRRIAERTWDYEIKCPPLSWNADCEPLLNDLGIQTSAIDATTRDLLSNPRELALFVDLAQHSGAFNVVTGQALAQRYLDKIVRADPDLGSEAIETIESIAKDMLQARSLTIPHQRVIAPAAVLRKLLSLNVLQETHDGKLTFGHQTLLDVLVISGAFRNQMGLDGFIKDLPPVPFVRPSIRSFVAQLAAGERREFRKQVRKVLMGDASFHIRRLVAEAFAEQTPHDDDWPLIRDLRKQHREVFQVIYMTAQRVEWHYLWLRHLVPLLKEARDSEGLAGHVYRIAQWKNADPSGIVAFWHEVTSLSFVDSGQLLRQLPFYLADVNPEHLPQIQPLLARLLDRPITEHSSLGKVLARSVEAGVATDEMLWRFVAGAVTEDDVLGFGLSDKLHCQHYEFIQSNEPFFIERMKASTRLLDLAIQTIEDWSNLRVSKKGGWTAGNLGFLDHTSYRKSHQKSDFIHVDSENVLLDAMEGAILHHAGTKSDWWRENRERLCVNPDLALRYFAIRALTSNPVENIELAGRMLSDPALLESELSYEVGDLITSAFNHLDSTVQDDVMQSILSVHEEWATNGDRRRWVEGQRAALIVTIPCYLRSPETQTTLDNYENVSGRLERLPNIHRYGGYVLAPFSYEVFLNIGDEGVVRLLAHYTGEEEDDIRSLIGGAREVGAQLSGASSRSPTRFLSLLSSHWSVLPAAFRNDIMDGVANHLAHRFGNLQAGNSWEPLEQPEGASLGSDILGALEAHSHHWHHNRSASNALEACAHVIESVEDASRLVFLAAGFLNLREERMVSGDTDGLLTSGMNMVSGRVAGALMILACNFAERNVPFPTLLKPVLQGFARSENPALRAVILPRLPYLQSKLPDIGWDLFHLVMRDASGLWHSAERCLYHAYYHHFDKVSDALVRLRSEGRGRDLETWGRISALAALTSQTDFSVFLKGLEALDSTEAWQGGASVWSHPENLKLHRDQCIAGLTAGLLASSQHAKAVGQQVDQIFRDHGTPIAIPLDLMGLCFSVFESDGGNRHQHLFGFHEWLNATAQRDPEHALAATEIYLDYAARAKPHLYDHDNNLTQLMTRLFAEAEEREESDNGEMLRRVASVQDALLALGLEAINNWLKSAERL